MKQARELEPKQTRRHHFDLGGFDKIEVELVEGILFDARYSQNKAASSSESDRPSSFFRNLELKATGWNDPVLQCETLLRMALAELGEGRMDSAQKNLQQWRDHGPFVENASLQTLYRKALKLVETPHYTFGVGDLDAQLDEAKEMLCEWTATRYGSAAEAEKRLKMTAGRITDMRARWRDKRRP